MYFVVSNRLGSIAPVVSLLVLELVIGRVQFNVGNELPTEQYQCVSDIEERNLSKASDAAGSSQNTRSEYGRPSTK